MADVIKIRLYLPEKPKPLSKIILNTCINLKQKNETEIETEIEILFDSFYFFLPATQVCFMSRFFSLRSNFFCVSLGTD